jgi:hypothetical protein
LAIVGAGPVGLIASLHALHAGHEVHIYSVDDKNNSSTAINWPEELKSGKGELSAYGEDLDLNRNSLEHLFIESKIRGGFANVWGATWGRFSSLTSSEWHSAFEKVDHYVWSSNPSGKLWVEGSFAREFHCTCFEIPTENIRLRKLNAARVASLALINHDCNCVQSGSSTCDHGSIFDASQLFKACQEFSSFKIFESVRVESFEDLGHGIQLVPRLNGIIYDKVVLASGPISNSRIILESDPSISELIIHDNAMIYVPLVNLFKKRKHSGSFAFSQFQIAGTSGTSLRFHQQIYAHPELFINRITTSVPKFLGGVLGKILELASGRINIGIVYLDQQISPRASLTRNRGLSVHEPETKLTTTQQIRLHYDIWRNFSKVGFLWFWPIAKKGLPGASFHVGALKQGILDPHGQILNNPKVGVAGSLALEQLEPGPITNTSMAQAIRLLDKML